MRVKFQLDWGCRSTACYNHGVTWCTRRQVEGAALPSWTFYRSANEVPLVSQEIQDKMSKAARIKLNRLMHRIEHGETTPGDVRPLTKRIDEARLSCDGQEYRLHFAQVSTGGRALILGLQAVDKRARKASQQDIKLSETRLTDWESRHPA